MSGSIFIGSTASVAKTKMLHKGNSTKTDKQTGCVRENGGTRTYLLRALRAFLLNSLRSAFKVAAEKRKEPQFTWCRLSFTVFEQ